jgi:cytoskeleton protein RodZ
MNSVGAILKTERERQNRDTAEIAEELCITKRYLRAIEQDDLKSLPGSFFYKSFVRQYAAVLGIDEDLLRPGVDALVAMDQPADVVEVIVNPSSLPASVENARSPMRSVDPLLRDSNRRYFPEGRIWMPVAGLTAVLLLCSGFYAWWIKAPQTRVARAVQNAVQNSVMTPVKSSSAPGATGAINVTTSTDPDGVNRVVLTLSATEATWLSISADGKRIFSGVLQPSQTKTLSGADVAQMKVGNAGGIDVMWNGKSIGPIGPRGQVRDVLFTKDNFEIIQPMPPAGTL